MIVRLELAPRTTFVTTTSALGMSDEAADDFEAKRDPIWAQFMMNQVNQEAAKLASLEPAGSS